jgi:hypothetical protein
VVVWVFMGVLMSLVLLIVAFFRFIPKADDAQATVRELSPYAKIALGQVHQRRPWPVIVYLMGPSLRGPPFFEIPMIRVNHLAHIDCVLQCKRHTLHSLLT